MQSSNLPAVAGIPIPVDEFGRYNLNALHKAAGGDPNKLPSLWLRNGAAKELIEAVTKQRANLLFGSENPVHVVRGGMQPGAFAHEIVAVSYAGWISPEFQIKVNLAFLAYHKGELAPVVAPADPQPAKPMLFADELRIMVESGLLSKRAAVRRFDAWAVIKHPGMERYLHPVRVAPSKAEVVTGATGDLFADPIVAEPITKGRNDIKVADIRHLWPLMKDLPAKDELLPIYRIAGAFRTESDYIREYFVQFGVLVRGNRPFPKAKNKRRYELTALGRTIGSQCLPRPADFWLLKSVKFLLERGVVPNPGYDQ